MALVNASMEQPLHLAAAHGQYKVVATMLQHGADCNARDRLGRYYYCSTAIFLALLLLATTCTVVVLL